MPKKSLGQYFLRCQWVAKTLVEAAEISPQDTILEIGPGRGELTRFLAQRAKLVIAVEKDTTLSIELAQKLKQEKTENVKVVPDDILVCLKRLRLKNYKAVGNIPYYLTSRLFRILLEQKQRPELIVFTIQKEVAQRITAQPPRINLLGISVQVFGKPEIVKLVPKTCFWPQPKVNSAIIKISHISDAIFTKNRINPGNFFEILRLGFSQKRKLLLNNLKKAYGKSALEHAFKKAKIPFLTRAEELSLAKWTKLTKELKNQ